MNSQKKLWLICLDITYQDEEEKKNLIFWSLTVSLFVIWWKRIFLIVWDLNKKSQGDSQPVKYIPRPAWNMFYWKELAYYGFFLIVCMLYPFCKNPGFFIVPPYYI